MPPDTDPLLARRRLGNALAKLRTAAGLTLQQAAGNLDWSMSKLIRTEAGRQGIQVTDLKALLAEYGITDPGEAARLADMARAGRRGRPWHARYAGILTDPAERLLLSAEESAAGIMEHRTLAYPPLLQTDEYARGLMTWAEAAAVPRTGEYLELLAERRRRIAASAVPVRFTIDEGVLLRDAGGRITRGQVLGLQEQAAQIGADVRIVPFAVGGYPRRPHAFTVTDLSDGGSIAFLGTGDPGPGPARALDDPRAVAQYRARFESIHRISVSIADASVLLEGLAAAPRQAWAGPDGPDSMLDEIF